jgi:Tfp pilus assembly protein PilE
MKAPRGMSILELMCVVPTVGLLAATAAQLLAVALAGSHTLAMDAGTRMQSELFIEQWRRDVRCAEAARPGADTGSMLLLTEGEAVLYHRRADGRAERRSSDGTTLDGPPVSKIAFAIDRSDALHGGRTRVRMASSVLRAGAPPRTLCAEACLRASLEDRHAR